MDIKIGDVLQDPPGVVGPGTSAAAQAARVEEDGNFLTALRSTRAQLEGESLERLVGMIELQAQRLVKSPVPGELALYRELVRKFLKEVGAKNSKLEKRHDRRNRTLSIIKTIDDRLQEFTDDLLAGQLSNLEILAAVDELRGMLTDLLI